MFSTFDKDKSWRRTLRRVAGAYAPNTIRTYRASFSKFESWCKQMKKSALPASPSTVAQFLCDQSNTKSL